MKKLDILKYIEEKISTIKRRKFYKISCEPCEYFHLVTIDSNKPYQFDYVRTELNRQLKDDVIYSIIEDDTTNNFW